MYSPSAQQGFPSPDPGIVYGILLAILRGVAYTVEVFLRRPGTIGKQAHHGLVTVAGFVLMLIWAYIWAGEYLHTRNPQYELGPFILFIILWAAASWAHIIGRGLRNHWGGYPRLSYDGKPWLRWGDWDELKIKERLEPVAVWIVACLVALVNIPLAAWLGIAGFCLAASIKHDNWRRKERVRELDDLMARQMEGIADMRRWGRGRW